MSTGEHLPDRTIASTFPAPSTTFIGRTEELDEIAALLADPTCRLLTLVGPGGIGKTRLAIEVATSQRDSFADAAFFVPLQSVASRDLLAPAIIDGIGMPLYGQEETAVQLHRYLQSRQMLLVLDNFEHLLDGAELLSDILREAPGVKLLVTSREVLNLQEEWVRVVEGLPYPASEREANPETFCAVQLFVDRARRVRGDFSFERERVEVIRISQLVQGMPLALELAASWVRTLPSSAIVDEIRQGLDLLQTTVRNVPERHRSIEAVFCQSWKFLSEPEREVFRRLSVFRGGFDREAVEEVVGATRTVLHALVDKSLLRLAPSGRYHIHELLRQYAAEQLATEPSMEVDTRERHEAYYLSFLQRQEGRLKGDEQVAALAEIESELDNIRAAWELAVAERHGSLLQKAMGSLFLYYQMRGRFQEGKEAFCKALSQSEGVDPSLYGKLCLFAAWFYAILGYAEEARAHYEEAYTLLRHGALPGALALASSGLTFLRDIDYVDPELTGRRTQEAFFRRNLDLFRETGDWWATGFTLYSLGSLAYYLGDYEEAKAYQQQSLDYFRAHNDQWALTWPLQNLGAIALELDQYEEARHAFEEALAICMATGDRGGIAYSLGQLGTIAARQEEYQGSWHYLRKALKITLETQGAWHVSYHLLMMAKSLAALGHSEQAVELLSFLQRFTHYQWVRDDIHPHLERLASELPAAAFTAARVRGETGDLQTIVGTVLQELTQLEEQQRPVKPAHPSETGQPLVESLSERELEVLQRVASGRSNREIASDLIVTVGTVKKHLNNIFGKLQVQSRTQAVARARQLNLLP